MNADPVKTQQLEDLRHLVSPLLQARHPEAGHEGHAHAQPAPDKAAMQNRLYSLYTRPSQHEGKGLRAIRDTAGVKRFQALLTAANNSRWSWTPDCKFVEAKPNGILVALPDGNSRLVNPMTFDGPNHEGRGRLLVRPEVLEDQPAWHFFFGEDGINSKQDRIVRLYWDICAEAAPLLVNTLTSELNRNKVPFHFKLLKDPAAYGRADSAVLYLPQFAWDRSSAVVRDIHAKVAPYLRDAVPCFTKRLSVGLGLAEDPGGGESFGMTWTKRIVDRWDDASFRSLDEAVGRMALRFEHDGVGPGRMHLRPDTKRDYSLDDLAGRRTGAGAA